MEINLGRTPKSATRSNRAENRTTDPRAGPSRGLSVGKAESREVAQQQEQSSRAVAVMPQSYLIEKLDVPVKVP